jgi:hypothetical protein
VNQLPDNAPDIELSEYKALELKEIGRTCVGVSVNGKTYTVDISVSRQDGAEACMDSNGKRYEVIITRSDALKILSGGEVGIEYGDRSELVKISMKA